jgi:predicted SprT family Zn-dependent metalloprotease
MADSFRGGGDIFGSALLPAKEGFGVVANVYADRTRELADGREFEVILGRVIAHELGHLLLGKNAHSAAGIMHARWRAQDLGLSRQAAMLFLPGEAKRIRAQVMARTVGQLSLMSVELPISNLSAASSQIFAHEPSSNAAPAERLNIHLGSPEAKLVVRLYDYAQVPSRVLTRAEHETARVFQIAGIQLSWVECGLLEADKKRFLNCEHVTDPLGLYLTVIPQHMAAWFHRPHRFGTSFGMRAVVFHHQVEESARNENFSQALILGCVMAHELGHLLLGKNHGRGMMMDTFVRRAFELAEKGKLVFTPDQAEQMRARILKSS